MKKASSMLACENAECARRFCEHCLHAHLQDPAVDSVRHVPPQHAHVPPPPPLP